MSVGNIFLALSKYNSATDENYLTESLVFLLNSLLERERAVALNILNQLCVNNNEFCFDVDEAISVSTQDVTEQGTPDIKVSSPDKLIYVEVKHDSPLGYQQLERYKKALEPSTATIKHVALLTRFAIDFKEDEEKPYKHVCWFEVYNWLVSAKIQDSLAVYLIEQFKSFLEVKQMAIQKVGWEYINGVPALGNLIHMIQAGIQSVKIPIYRNSTGWDYKGFLLENQEFWCGIVYAEPEVIRFQILDKNKFDLKPADEDNVGYSISYSGDNRSIFIDLPLESKHFFSLDKDTQLDEITKFVKTAYTKAQETRVKSKSPKQSRKPKKVVDSSK